MIQKSSLQEIQSRFDRDVERFSNIETGQVTTLDAAHNLELITDAISYCHPQLSNVMDIGCGAGNYMVKLLPKVPNPDVTLVDLSQPMLDRAKLRVSQHTKGSITLRQADFRTLSPSENQVEVIVATAVLHHLRDDNDWNNAFKLLYDLLLPGGSLWIFDLVEQRNERLQEHIYHKCYGDYLSALGGPQYRDQVFAYIEYEDSPRTLGYQLNLMESVGFQNVDVLHKNLCFASFVGFKPPAL